MATPPPQPQPHQHLTQFAARSTLSSRMATGSIGTLRKGNSPAGGDRYGTSGGGTIFIITTVAITAATPSEVLMRRFGGLSSRGLDRRSHTHLSTTLVALLRAHAWVAAAAEGYKLSTHRGPHVLRRLKPLPRRECQAPHQHHLPLRLRELAAQRRWRLRSQNELTRTVRSSSRCCQRCAAAKPMPRPPGLPRGFPSLFR